MNIPSSSTTTTPLLNCFRQHVYNNYLKPIRMPLLHQSLSRKANQYSISNRQFIYTCYFTRGERVVIAQYQQFKKGAHLIATNLITYNKRIVQINQKGKVISDTRNKQLLKDFKGRVIYNCYLEDFYFMHSYLLQYPNFNIDNYFKVVLSAPEIAWWEEDISLINKTKEIVPSIWWQRGKEKVRIAKEPTGIYLSLYTDHLKLAASIKV